MAVTEGEAYGLLRERARSGETLTWPRADQSQSSVGRCRRRQVVLPEGAGNAAQTSASGVELRSGNTSENHYGTALLKEKHSVNIVDCTSVYCGINAQSSSLVALVGKHKR